MAVSITTWANTAACDPAHAVAPANTDEVCRVVEWAGKRGLPVRAFGSGHSFTPLAMTEGVLVSLQHLSGIREVTPTPGGGAVVRVGAGTRLRDLNRALWRRGLALANLGDIDAQSIAGAVATGTHGTGAGLQGLAAQVVGLQLVAADGTVWQADAARHPEIFEAGRLSLGALGIVTEVELACVPAYLLHAREEPASLDAVLDTLPALMQDNRNMEFFWFPHTRQVLLKRNNITETAAPLPALRRWWEDDVVENRLFGAVCEAGWLAPALVPVLAGASARLLTTRDYADASYKVYCTRRTVRFAESEWALPRTQVRGVLEEIAGWLAASGVHVSFPVEVRCAAADDVWLSTAYGSDVAYVAVHTYSKVSHHRYFAAVADIMAQVGARPHWGKLHPRTAAQLAALYPRWDDFQRVRDHLDPGRVFTNPHVRRVLGP